MSDANYNNNEQQDFNNYQQQSTSQVGSDFESQTIGNYKINNTQITIKPNIGKIDIKLFVGQIPREWNEDDVTAFFSKYGEIIESQIIRDQKNTHRGCAFVKFASMTKAEEAMKQLLNVHLEGANATLQLRWADGEQERLGLIGIDESQQTKLFVGSIPKSCTEDNLYDVFKIYGKIDNLHLMKDNDGVSRGCAFIKYELKESALLAIRCLNAQAYIGDSNKPLEVRFADKKGKTQPTSKPTTEVTTTPKQPKQQVPQQAQDMMKNPWEMYQAAYSPYGYPWNPYYPMNPMNQMMGGRMDNQQMYMQNPMAQYPKQNLEINDLSEKNPQFTKKQGPAGANLFIFHLPNDFRESQLYEVFEKFGKIVSARIMTEKHTKKSKGFGFLSYETAESANEAIQHMNGYQIGGKRLKVQLKKGDDDGDQDEVPTLANQEFRPY